MFENERVSGIGPKLKGALKMGIELKTVNPVVFDDKDYCMDQDGQCNKLDVDTEFYCWQFGKGVRYHKSGNGLTEKCQECKDHWLEAKREEPADKIVIDGYRFHCMKKRLYVDGKIMVTLTCDDEDRRKFVETLCYPEKQYPISTHDGLFTYTGMIQTTGMYSGDSGKMYIEIMILIVELSHD